MIDEILEAIDRKDVKSLNKIIRRGININTTDEEGMTLLMYAVLYEENDDTEIVEFLIKAGADINMHDKGQEFTALHFAARDQKRRIVNILLENGATVDAEDVFGNTPLFRCLSINSPDTEIVKSLIEKGANKSKKNKHGVSPIDTATMSDMEDILRVFNQ